MTITGNQLFWAKGKPDTIIPTKRDEDMGYDIYANFPEDSLIIPPHKTRLVPTKLHCAMPEGYGLELRERGSTGSKGIKVGAGIIDSGYRGEIFVALSNVNNHPVVIAKKGVTLKDIYGEIAPNDVLIYPYEKAICQGIVRKVYKMDEQEITLDELLSIKSERGEDKLGMSGK